MAVGVGLVFSGTLNPSGTLFLFAQVWRLAFSWCTLCGDQSVCSLLCDNFQGTLDGICGGILLYLGYALLTHDFPDDAAKHAGGAGVFSCTPAAWRRWAML